MNARSSPPTHLEPPLGLRHDGLPPVIVLGGNDNALSIARSLGRRSIPVHALGCDAEVKHSRYVRPLGVPPDLSITEAIRFLISPASDFLRGSVLLAASDSALEGIADGREALQPRFHLDLSNPTAQKTMLDKLATYEAATEAGVSTPRYWRIESVDSLSAWRPELVYPLIVKPKLSHLFQRRFKGKFIVAHSFEEVQQACQIVAAEKIDVLLVETIPGPDSRLCSYYTYLDEEGTPLFDFTKRVIRRHPVNMGLATYHVTDQVDGVREPALKLFRQVGLRGLANAEFKLDHRDGRLKLMECNARFTAANALVARAGFDLASFVYNRAVGIPQPPLTRYRSRVHMWDPIRDFRAYRELSQRGELTFLGWLRSVMRPQVLPVFSWRDPVPAVVRLTRRFRKVRG